MSAGHTSKWSRRFVLVSAGFLVIWQAGELLGFPRRTGVLLGLYGFVLHMVFGKGYALIPAYFDREFTYPWAPPIHLLFTATGTIGLSLASLRLLPSVVTSFAALAWTVGVSVFLAAIIWTIRDNLTGRDTGTGEPNADRHAVDRLSNAFMPIALVYLALGSYETLAAYTVVPGLLDGYFPRITHLLAAGTALLLVFAIGFRLLPRFLVSAPPWPLVVLVLPTGAIGPLILAWTLGRGWGFRFGAVIEAVAVLGFAAAILTMYRRSDRKRVGFNGVVLGVVGGSLAVLLGVWFAFNGVTPALIHVHYRLNILGFLGLTIVGIAYQFYPPAVGSFWWVSDRTALVSIIGLGGGLVFEAGGRIIGIPLAVFVGQISTLAGSILYAGVLAGLFYERYQ